MTHDKQGGEEGSCPVSACLYRQAGNLLNHRNELKQSQREVLCFKDNTVMYRETVSETLS